jgi:hypothetical protein
VVGCTIDGTVVFGLDDGMGVCALDEGTVICALDDAHFLIIILFLDGDVINILRTVQVSAVAGDIIQQLLTRLPAMVIDADAKERLPHPNVDVYLAVSN